MMKPFLVMTLALCCVACDAENGNDKVNGSVNVAAGQAAIAATAIHNSL